MITFTTPINWQETAKRIDDAERTLLVTGLTGNAPHGFISEDYPDVRLALGFGYTQQIRNYDIKNNALPNAFKNPFWKTVDILQDYYKGFDKTSDIMMAFNEGKRLAKKRIAYAENNSLDRDVFNSLLYHEMGLANISARHLILPYKNA
jgi:hypothetical protein